MAPPKANTLHAESVAAVAKSNRTLAGKLYPSLVAAHGADNNLVSSPYCVSSVLSMLYTGAAGATAEQMRTALSLPDKDSVLHEGYEDITSALRMPTTDDTFTLEVANRIFAMTGFILLDAFTDKTTAHYAASAQNLDFNKSEEASKTINEWVGEKTREKIKNAVSPADFNADTRLVLVSAIYMKAEWQDMFAKEDTSKQSFHVSPSETVQVEMMHCYHAMYEGGVNKELDCTILRMPYRSADKDRFSMMFFLPTEAAGFASMEERFASFDFTVDNLEYLEYNVSIPKFKVETSHDLTGPLKAMGLTTIFDKEASDFANIANVQAPNRLTVSKATHKAFIVVDEEGTEAAAAAVCEGLEGCSGGTPLPPPIEFKCDRPFLFAIRDKRTQMVLFNGRVVNPNKN